VTFWQLEISITLQVFEDFYSAQLVVSSGSKDLEFAFWVYWTLEMFPTASSRSFRRQEAAKLFQLAVCSSTSAISQYSGLSITNSINEAIK